MLMMTVRQWHSYLGAFIAPTVLFLSVTGALQVFGLHEAHGAYTPSPIVVRLARIHKDQVFSLPAPKPDSAAKPKADRHAGADGPAKTHATPWAVSALKWFFLAVAVCLVASTLLGLWMAFTFSRRKGVLAVLLVAGAVAPLLLLALQP